VKTAHYKVDVSSMASLEEGFSAFKKDFGGKLDICVPCAGINKNVSFLDTSFEDHQRLLGVNVSGVYFTAQLAAKMMIENGTEKGSIVLVASIASYMAIRSQSSTAYCGTKGAVRAMCPAIAAELNQYVCTAIVSKNYCH
jgi:NAD(P)-dependent dehydrogenase (short-subunit alcohol dehydrogenase family)